MWSAHTPYGKVALGEETNVFGVVKVLRTDRDLQASDLEREEGTAQGRRDDGSKQDLAEGDHDV